MAVRVVSRRVRDGLTVLLKSPADVLASSTKVAFDFTAGSLRSSRRKQNDTPGIAQDAIEGALRAGSETGTDLAPVAKGAVMGVVLGVGNAGKLSVGATTDAVRAAVWATGQVGGDIAKVTRVAMEGAIEAGRQLGMSAEEVASAAGAGALEAAAGLGDTAVKAVTKALSGTISGVRIVLDAGIPKPKVLVVDANRGSLESLVQQLARENFRTIGASSVEELDHAMLVNGSIVLVLIDVSEFHDEIWDCCDSLSKVKVPFVVVAPQRSPAILRDSMKHGASGVLTKPIAAKEVAEHIRSLLGD